MKSILIHLDERTCQRLDDVAPAAKRQRAEFIRRAVLRAIMEAEEAKTQAAYRTRPDSESEADDWSTAEESRL